MPTNNFKKRQIKARKKIISQIVLYIMISLTFISAIATFGILNNIHKADADLTSANRIYSVKKETYDRIKPTKNDLTTGKFDLQSKMEKADKTYGLLTRSLFGDGKSVSELTQHKALYEKYFGESGFSDIRDACVDDDTFVADKNLETNITYSGFDVTNKTVNIAIYTKYTLRKTDKNAKFGISLITTKYSFNLDKATNTDIKTAYLKDSNE